MHTLPSAPQMYRALVERDACFDGLFFACVTTTGIFCRSLCTAKKPKPEHVLFVATVQEALHRGFRPCKICRPLEQNGALPGWVSTLIDHVRRSPEVRLNDAGLRRLHIDPVRARRTFKQRFGVTFHAFARAWRLGEAMQRLHQGGDVLTTGFGAGYESASGFRDAFARLFGAPPGRARGAAVLNVSWLETPLGPMLAVASARGLVLLEFVDRRALTREIEQVRRSFASAIVPGDNPHLGLVARELSEYFRGARREFTVPLDWRGTPFQERVWQELRGVAHGATVSYSHIARALGGDHLRRAVGGAVGNNRIAIVVPCHRVLRSDGSLSGYAGGVWRKQWLLTHEGARVCKKEELRRL